MVCLKNKNDLEMLRQSGGVLIYVLKTLAAETKPGVSLKSLDARARKLIEERGAKPSFLGYKPNGALQPYPAAICTSVNNQIVHGPPSDYILKDGDILKIDFGIDYKSYFTDGAVTLGIGEISSQAAELIKTVKGALEQAIEVCLPGNHLGDIGWAIEQYVSAHCFKVIRGLTGHGVGFSLHEEPIVYNYGEKGKGMELKPGMVLAIEPMISAGSPEIKQLDDESYATKDGSLSAHFEKTIAITKTSPEVLTPF
jgi:methionyl aminopeptidase